MAKLCHDRKQLSFCCVGNSILSVREFTAHVKKLKLAYGRVWMFDYLSLPDVVLCDSAVLRRVDSLLQNPRTSLSTNNTTASKFSLDALFQKTVFSLHQNESQMDLFRIETHLDTWDSKRQDVWWGLDSLAGDKCSACRKCDLHHRYTLCSRPPSTSLCGCTVHPLMNRSYWLHLHLLQQEMLPVLFSCSLDGSEARKKS